MKFMVAAVLLLCSASAWAACDSVLVECRYSGPPKRTSSGLILRRNDVMAAYKKAHPCPSTGKTIGACPGWAMNHVVPLACGGVDAVWNLQWMRIDVKHMVDAYERKINAATPPIEDTAACVNVGLPQ